MKGSVNVGKRVRAAAAAAAIVLLCGVLGRSTSGFAAAGTPADAAFADGRFEQAQALYAQALQSNPRDAAAAAGLARVELYANELDAASLHALIAERVDLHNAVAAEVLGTVRDRTAIAEQARAIDVPASGVGVPFVRTEPVPMVRIVVDGHPADVIVDTGAPDVALDPEFAHQIGVTVDGGYAATFAGGLTAQLREGSVRSVQLGPVTVHDATATILPSRALSQYEHRRIDGIIGAAFLARFTARIDYPNRRLVLFRRGARVVAPPGAIVARFWLYGDNDVFVRGSIDALEQQLFLIDSGAAGAGFMPEAWTVAAAHLRTMPNRAAFGMGAGGAVSAIPVVAERLCVATACQANARGLYTPSGSPLAAFPFRTAGIVSHEFLRRYAVTLDFDAMRVILTP